MDIQVRLPQKIANQASSAEQLLFKGFRTIITGTFTE